MTQQADTIINAQWIVTADSNHRVLKDHALIIKEKRIVALAPVGQHDFVAKTVVDRNHHILMPGLINAHTHAAMTLFRGLADDLPLTQWLNDHIWPAEAAWVDEPFVQDGTELAIAEMLRSGTTCFSDMYFFPNVVARTANEAHIRCAITFPVLDFPSAWANGPDDYLHRGVRLHDTYRNHDLIQVHFGPHAPYTVSDEPLKRIATISVETGMNVQIHLHETQHEVDEALDLTGLRPIERLHKLGLLTPQLQAVHMTALNDQDIRLLAENGVHVIHCPESNLKLASGFCPVARLCNAGVNVALGTDGAASNNDLDMFSEMRTAALLAKGVAGDPAAIPADEALRMATINGARALGIDDVTGSLEVGKWADVIAIDIDTPESQPLFNPVSQIVYSTHSHQVQDVWVAGDQVMASRELLTLDYEDILFKAQSWQEDIALSETHLQ